MTLIVTVLNNLNFCTHIKIMIYFIFQLYFQILYEKQYIMYP